MYLLNTELSVNWTLYSGVAPPALNELSIAEHKPNKIIIHNIPITVDNYILPTQNSLGNITYKFTPAIIGLWKISLHISDTLIDTRNILVSESDTIIKKFIDSSLL